MSAYGTKREFGQGHFQVGKPMHCRRSNPSVGSSTVSKPESEALRARAFDDPN